MLSLYEVQRYCDRLQYPKVDSPNGKVALISVLFKQLLLNNVVDPEGFQSWSEDERFQDDSKAMAVIQTTDFIRFVNDLIDRDDDNDDDDDNGYDCDASDSEGDVVEAKDPISMKLLSVDASEKAQRQMLKKERRQLKVSSRTVQ